MGCCVWCSGCHPPPPPPFATTIGPTYPPPIYYAYVRKGEGTELEEFEERKADLGLSGLIEGISEAFK